MTEEERIEVSKEDFCDHIRFIEKKIEFHKKRLRQYEITKELGLELIEMVIKDTVKDKNK